ncbi:MAG TPA: hypothetical protein VE987_14390, partial [Polyangiaceae bacterium]|nr:hypothetical protein [Polyangiaceae bacterium]
AYTATVGSRSRCARGVARVVLAGALAGAGCGRDASRASGFAARWGRLADDGELLVVDGGGVLASVRRAQAVAAPSSPTGAEPARSALPESEALRVIRAGLVGLHRCALAEPPGQGSDVKAIVTLRVLPTGAVDSVHVEAPGIDSSDRSRLPACLGDQIRRWRFPPFAGAAVTLSYPFVFVGPDAGG